MELLVGLFLRTWHLSLHEWKLLLLLSSCYQRSLVELLLLKWVTERWQILLMALHQAPRGERLSVRTIEPTGVGELHVVRILSFWGWVRFLPVVRLHNMNALLLLILVDDRGWNLIVIKRILEGIKFILWLDGNLFQQKRPTKRKYESKNR